MDDLPPNKCGGPLPVFEYMKYRAQGTETGWHTTWGLPMPGCRAPADIFHQQPKSR